MYIFQFPKSLSKFCFDRNNTMDKLRLETFIELSASDCLASLVHNYYDTYDVKGKYVYHHDNRIKESSIASYIYGL